MRALLLLLNLAAASLIVFSACWLRFERSQSKNTMKDGGAFPDGGVGSTSESGSACDSKVEARGTSFSLNSRWTSLAEDAFSRVLSESSAWAIAGCVLKKSLALFFLSKCLCMGNCASTSCNPIRGCPMQVALHATSAMTAIMMVSRTDVSFPRELGLRRPNAASSLDALRGCMASLDAALNITALVSAILREGFDSSAANHRQSQYNGPTRLS